MKKIAVVTRVLVSGGTENVILGLLEHFRKQGIESLIITIDDTCQCPQQAYQGKVISAGQKYRNPILEKFRKYIKVRKILSDENPDIVLSMPEDIGIYVILAMLGSKIPVVVSERNNPWIMPYKKASRFLRRLMYPFAAGLIFQTRQAASFFPHSIQNKGVVLPNPLDVSKLPEPYQGKREKCIVGAGRLDKQKNFPLLIKAFARFLRNHSDYKLVIYGEGSQRKELETLAKSLLPETTFRLPGRISNLPQQMVKCAMFVLSSDYEGVPNALIEAMAMGMPVVTTDCAPGGAASLVQNMRNGILVPVDDIGELSEGMSYIADNPDEAEQFSNEAIRIRARYDINSVASEWLSYLEKCKAK